MHLSFIFWRMLPTFAHIPVVATVTEMIIISNCSYNKICNEQTVDMLFTFKYN
jgi:hypothetical protein